MVYNQIHCLHALPLLVNRALIEYKKRVVDTMNNYILATTYNSN